MLRYLLLPLFLLQHFSNLQTVDVFTKTMEHDYTLVDVRTPEEFADGALPNAINISVTSLGFPFEINQLDKEKPVMIYCKGGTRSARAALAMKALGFTTIYELEGGYLAWKAANN
jgi:rhodanese-related sulfurtransferase